jgi:hypothetical protein
MWPYVLCVVGCWFGMLVMALVRINSERKACEGCREIALVNRHGERVMLCADGSRRCE